MSLSTTQAHASQSNRELGLGPCIVSQVRAKNVPKGVIEMRIKINPVTET